MTLGEKIRYYRKKANFTQAEVAEKLGFSRENIYKYEKGVITNIPLSRLEGLAALFDISPSELVNWDDEQEKPTPDNEDELDMAEVVSHLSNEELYDLLDAVNKRLRELNR